MRAGEAEQMSSSQANSHRRTDTQKQVFLERLLLKIYFHCIFKNARMRAGEAEQMSSSQANSHRASDGQNQVFLERLRL